MGDAARRLGADGPVLRAAGGPCEERAAPGTAAMQSDSSDLLSLPSGSSSANLGMGEAAAEGDPPAPYHYYKIKGVKYRKFRLAPLGTTDPEKSVECEMCHAKEHSPDPLYPTHQREWNYYWN